MTAIRGTIGINKRPGDLGVHSLDHFRMTVPDLAVAERFYREFGLKVRDEGNGLGLYTDCNTHRWVSLTEASKKALQGFTFAVFEEDFESLRRHVEALGVRLLDPPRGLESDGFWFQDNNGLMVEVKIAPKTSLDAKAPFGDLDLPVPANVAGSWSRASKPLVRPRRFAHMLIFTPSVPESISFYSRILGLRLSDRTGDIIAFLHGIHGCDHHMIAFVTSGGKPAGLHHCSWDMGSVNGIGLAAQRMADAGFTKGWGLGRHVLGSNYFHYMQDPWGSWSEYSADIDYIAVDHDWEAKDHPEEDGIYVWGPALPQDFIHNYEAD